MQARPRQNRYKLLLLVFVLLLLILLAVFGLSKDLLSPQKIRELADSGGMLGLAIFSFGFLAIILLLMPPTIMTISSGLLFGSVVGLIVSVSMINIGGAIIFIVSRKLGRQGLRDLFSSKLASSKFASSKFASSKFEDFEKKLEARGLLAVVIMRLTFIPFGVVCVSAALSSVTKKDFLLGTFAGTFPAAFMLSWLGDVVLEISKSGDFSLLISPAGFISVLLFALAMLFPFALERWRGK